MSDFDLKILRVILKLNTNNVSDSELKVDQGVRFCIKIFLDNPFLN